jgi:DNA-directed RNA polymerase subunit RPC12/RpoP
MYQSGEKPEYGKYKCAKCGKTVVINETNETLLECSKCGVVKWKKVA